MKKTILLLLALTFSFCAVAQTKLSSYNYPASYVYSSNEKYPDTLKCFFHEYGGKDYLKGDWQVGYIILINGYIMSKNVGWSPKYAPMALGFFINKFLFKDKTPIPASNKVIQLSLIDSDDIILKQDADNKQFLTPKKLK